MSNDKNHHIVSFRTYFFILMGLLVLTFLTVAVTSIELGPLTVFTALLLASTKSFLVLTYFMHLKFDEKLFRIMVGLVILVFIIVMVITFLDYSFR